ncbi:MAG: hypothetical protein EBR82_07220 [Caulobacteraceae bacterium]|nr:hypothetical protein [Caulobacteraceae bacterium]
MGPFFDPRKLLRTPGFAPDGLYDEREEAPALPPPPPPPQYRPRTPMAEYDAPEPRGMSGLLEDAPVAVPQREYGPLPPRQSQRMELPEPPAPPKVGLTRKILGTVASMYVPPIGREILAPGYDRQMREYQGRVATMMGQSKLDHEAAQTQSQMAMAEASAARRDAERARGRSYGERLHNVGQGQVAVDINGNPKFTNPKPPETRIKMGRDNKPYFGDGVEGKDFYYANGSMVAPIMNNAPRSDRGYDTLKQSIKDAHPDWEQAEVDAEAAKLYQEQRRLANEAKQATANRANRPTAARGTGGLTANQSAAENRRKIQERTDAFIAESGGEDKALADINSWAERDETAEQVRQRLMAMKGEKLRKPQRGGKVDLRGALRGGGAAPAAKPAAAKPPAPAVGTVKGGYRFKGGDPASPSSWEQVK